MMTVVDRNRAGDGPVPTLYQNTLSTHLQMLKHSAEQWSQTCRPPRVTPSPPPPSPHSSKYLNIYVTVSVVCRTTL